jgi:hypothetical protein
MESRLEEYRQFFDEVLDDMAKSEETQERFENATREDKARWEHAANQMDGELREHPMEIEEDTPEEFQQRIAGESAGNLLLLRRLNARNVCACVARGSTHRAAARMLLENSLRRLAAYDAEVARRHLGE